MNITRAKKIVTIAYYTVLNRAPDKSGLNTWSAQLRDGKMDDIDLYYALFTSKEYQDSLKKKK